MPSPLVSTHVRASVFAHFGDEKRQRSLRHHALVTATYYRYFPNSGTYSESQRLWKRIVRRHDLCTTTEASDSAPGGTGSLRS